MVKGKVFKKRHVGYAILQSENIGQLLDEHGFSPAEMQPNENRSMYCCCDLNVTLRFSNEKNKSKIGTPVMWWSYRERTIEDIGQFLINERIIDSYGKDSELVEVDELPKP